MAVRIASIENHHHQEPPPTLRACPRVPTLLPVHRTLQERRALRRASYLAVARRPAMGLPSCSAVSMHPSLVVELQRSSLARRRAFVAAAHKFAATAAAAEFCAKQQQQQRQQRQQRRQQQQQQQQQNQAWPVLSLLETPVIATPPQPTATAATIVTARTGAATGLLGPSATAVRVRDNTKENPEIYFLSLLEDRGRAVTKKISSQEAGYVQQPTAKQILDYQSQPFMSDLVRKGDLDGLREAVKAGRGMDASNKFGESLVHIACRRGNMDVLRFLLDNGGSLTCCDDLGRFPLHEVCWAVRPRFDIVRLFLDWKRRPTTTTTPAATRAGNSNNNSNNENEVLNPLLMTDKRGYTPLRYVKEESWPMWRQFLDEIVDEYWPLLI